MRIGFVGTYPVALAGVLAFMACTRIASADAPAAASPGATATPPPPPVEAPKKPPAPPYSLPWALRPAMASTVVRLDGAFSFENSGFTYASTLLASYSFVKDVAVLARIGLVHDAPNLTYNATAITNPLVGATYTPQLAPGLRLPLFLAVSLPVGMGGGNPDTGTTWPAGSAYAAEQAGVYARSAMDNALFAVNYLGLIGGVGLAYMTHGWTFQAEATLLQYLRTRGEVVDKDEARTNFTTGLHVGYTIIKALTVSAELRGQVWLSSMQAVTKDPTKREQFTFGLGVRTRVDFVRDKIFMRPGIAYFHPIDDPMNAGGYNILFVDVPVSF